MTHQEFIPDVNGSRLQQFTTLAACCHVALGSFIFVGDRDLVHRVCRSPSFVVQCRKASGSGAQDNLALCTDCSSDDLHQ